MTGRALTILEMPTAMMISAMKLKKPNGELSPRKGSEKMKLKNWMARNAPPMIVILTPFERSRRR